MDKGEHIRICAPIEETHLGNEGIYIHALGGAALEDINKPTPGDYFVTYYPDNVAVYAKPQKEPTDLQEYKAIPISELEQTEIEKNWKYVTLTAAICINQVADGQLDFRKYFFRINNKDMKGNADMARESRMGRILGTLKDHFFNINCKKTGDNVDIVWQSQRNKILDTIKDANVSVHNKLIHDLGNQSKAA